MFTLTISTPFYNEEEGISYYIETLKKILESLPKNIKVSIIWINDGSSDETLKNLNEKKKLFTENEIKIISHKKNYGYGRTLFNSIKESKTDYLITYDSDCCYDYNLILKLIQNVQNNKSDIINVSYKLAKKKMKVSFFRNFLAFGSIFIYKILFKNLRKYNLSYFNCSFRIYKLNVINDIDYLSDDFNACAEILIKSSKKNINITEIAGENIGRNFGKSKMKVIKNIYNSLFTILKIKFNIKNKKNYDNEYEII